jgi:hypothetical protein
MYPSSIQTAQTAAAEKSARDSPGIWQVPIIPPPPQACVSADKTQATPSSEEKAKRRGLAGPQRGCERMVVYSTSTLPLSPDHHQTGGWESRYRVLGRKQATLRAGYLDTGNSGKSARHSPQFLQLRPSTAGSPYDLSTSTMVTATGFQAPHPFPSFKSRDTVFARTWPSDATGRI